MDKPELSIIVTTARDLENPYSGRPDLHLWEPLARTLAEQDCRYGAVELIIVDAYWEDHSDWFAAHPQPYPVKHVPATPNAWHQVGRSGACAQLNRGIAWADGEVVFFCHENTMFPPHFVSLLLDLYHRGTIPLATYVEDFSFDTEHDHGSCVPSPIEYNILGYTGKLVHKDSRLDATMSVDHAARVPWEWYFTYSSLPIDLALRINGWNECMDGVGSLVDCDVGGRIQLAGHGEAIVMHRGLWCVRPKPMPGFWSEKIRGEKIAGRCNYALLNWHRMHQEARAGALAHTGDELLEEMRSKVCGGYCPLRDRCQKREILDEFGFINDPAVYRQWRDRTYDYNLEGRVVDRKAGRAPFDRGYFHGEP